MTDNAPDTKHPVTLDGSPPTHTAVQAVARRNAPVEIARDTLHAVAIMGRTGNHRPWKKGNSWRGDLGAPTHTHFAAYAKGRLADFTSAIVSRHGFQLPRNAMPHLLPCAAEFEDQAEKTTPAASDPRKCKVRHGSGAFDPSAPNKGWLCWAYAKGNCPFKES